MKNLPQSILITGASSGIGEALAKYYAAEGVTLYISGRNHARLEDVAKACQDKGAEVIETVIDVTDRQAMQGWIEGCHRHKPLDLVIANAGIAHTEETSTHAREVFDINLGGVLNTLYPTIDCLKENGGGQIALISSMAGFFGLSSAPSYSASKCAVKAYGEALIPMLKQDNITISTICPGFVRSRITDKNKFKMPFFMETEDAAKLIATKLSQKKNFICFPWPMYLAVSLYSLFPPQLRLFINKFLPKKSS